MIVVRADEWGLVFLLLFLAVLVFTWWLVAEFKARRRRRDWRGDR